MRCLDGIIDSMDMNKFQEIVKEEQPGVLLSTGSPIVKQDLATEQ